MMKWLALVLLLLNLIWAAWAHDLLQPWGWGPESVHEPERLDQALQPDALQPAEEVPSTAPTHP
jgi:hypothetical protein